MSKILSIENLTVAIGEKKLVNQVSFEIGQGKIVALAGGSGSGKTTMALSILRLLSPALNLQQGKIIFEGRNLLELSKEEMRQIRGAKIGMVFQEPLSAFDPLFTLGQQLDETLEAHTSLSSQERYKKISDALMEVGLSEPKRIYASYPHQLSGGQRQRGMVAQAVIASPSLVIADEPTSNLDVTLQTKIMDLMLQLKKKNIAVLLIAHDLGMIARLADEMIVLKEGRIVEQGEVSTVIKNPSQEYTKALIEAAYLK